MRVMNEKNNNKYNKEHKFYINNWVLKRVGAGEGVVRREGEDGVTT